jgi:hypothetical protein
VLAGKTLATLVAAVITSVAAVGAGLATAWITFTVRDGSPAATDGWPAVVARALRGRVPAPWAIMIDAAPPLPVVVDDILRRLPG